MKTYNVTVTAKVQVEAENDETAQTIAQEWAEGIIDGDTEFEVTAVEADADGDSEKQAA